MLLLDNDDIARVLDVEACLDALERGYRAYVRGDAVMRPRSQIYVPGTEPDVHYCLKSMEGALFDTGYMALRLTSDIIRERSVAGTLRREKLARGPGDTYCGLILLFSVSELKPVAIMQDGAIQLLRVAATSALSVRLLARPDAGDLALLGSSGQAWAHLEVVRAVRALRRVRVYSPDAANRTAFAARACSELGLAAEAVPGAREAVTGADIVILATNASEPIIDGRWLAPGAHVVSIASGDLKTQRRELDDETLRRAGVVVAHSKQAAQEQRHGDLWVPVEKGILGWERIVDLAQVIANGAPRRTHADEITIFKNNGGLGLQFAAIAPRIYELARAAGIGRDLPDEWFLEKVKS